MTGVERGSLMTGIERGTLMTGVERGGAYDRRRERGGL